MKVAIGSETSGFALKEAIKAHLIKIGHEVMDVGAQSDNDRDIFTRRTGAGASLIANKQRGIYCGACESVFTTEKIGLPNNANALAMKSCVVSHDMSCNLAEKYLVGPWCEGFAKQRHLNNENGYAKMQGIKANQ